MVDESFNCRWLVLNIPSKVREIEVDNKLGDTIVEYMGIPENCFKIFFNLYEIKTEEKLTYEDWKNTSEMLKKITHVASLEVN